jgi:hypothetical protein
MEKPEPVKGGSVKKDLIKKPASKRALDATQPETFMEPFDLAEWPQMWGTKNIDTPRSYEKKITLKMPRSVTLKDGRRIEIPVGTKVEKRLEVGVYNRKDGKVRGLTTKHYGLISMLLSLYQKTGSRVIANSLSRFFDLLVDGSNSASMPRKGRRGAKYKQQFSELVQDAMNIVCSYFSKYTLPDGTEHEVERSFKFLSKRELFHRSKSSREFDVSRITLDEEFIKAIDAAGYKVKRYDEIVRLRNKPAQLKLLGYADFKLYDQKEFRRNAFEVADELDIGRKDKDKKLEDLRRFAMDVLGSKLGHGMIKRFELEKSANGRSWNFYIEKGPLPQIIDVEIINNPSPTIQNNKPSEKEKKQQEAKEQEEKEAADLQSFYESLDQDGKQWIRLYQEEGLKKTPGSYKPEPLREYCFFNAIKRYRDELEEEKANSGREDEMAAAVMESLRSTPKQERLTLKSPPIANRYLSGFERGAYARLAAALKTIAARREENAIPELF